MLGNRFWQLARSLISKTKEDVAGFSGLFSVPGGFHQFQLDFYEARHIVWFKSRAQELCNGTSLGKTGTNT
jgi:hypothetical protein